MFNKRLLGIFYSSLKYIDKAAKLIGNIPNGVFLIHNPIGMYPEKSQPLLNFIMMNKSPLLLMIGRQKTYIEDKRLPKQKCHSSSR